MELTVLGCGDAFGNDGRNNTSFLISNGEEHILIDCGATTLLRLKHEKVDIKKISTIIITHFHGDHFGGIPFLLICCLFEQRREEELTIIGPTGIRNKVLTLQESMYPGTADKLKELNLNFQEYEQGKTLNIGGKNIKAWQVEHSLGSLPHAVRLEWENKRIAFSGDTSWTDNLIEVSKGVDLFICECNFLERVSFGHLSYSELLEKKSLLNCGQLWLTHMADEVIHAGDFALNRLSDGQRISF